jgi:ABC-type multidrug transport system fused ATPase/permease subunit
MDLGFNFRMIILAWTDLETSLSAVTRIRQFTAVPAEGKEHVRPTELAQADTPTPPYGWPTQGSIAFKNFSASYTDEGKAALSGIELNIKNGEKIGLCGRTGSGKSSLVAALFGLLHQREGEIRIDGVPTTDVEVQELRSKIIALPQDSFFLRGTVRYNLAPWSADETRPVVEDERMKNALQQVQLWDKLSAAAISEQSALDLNLDNVEGMLSQGERQLFCLARAILMEGKIVVLDEATSRYVPPSPFFHHTGQLLGGLIG